MNQLNTFASQPVKPVNQPKNKAQEKAKEEKTLLFFVPSNPANMRRLSQPTIVTATWSLQDQRRRIGCIIDKYMYGHAVPLFEPSILFPCMKMN